MNEEYIKHVKGIVEEAGLKKISLNVNKKVLEMADDLTKIFGTTRTQTLSAIIMSGLKAQTSFSEKLWKQMKKDKNYKDKIRLIDKKLNELSRFKNKWAIDSIPS